MIWQVPKIWEGGDAWILGGGPSIINQFNIPKEISDKVLLKQLPLSAYSKYMEPIHDKHVIGINIAYLIGNWIDIVFFGDKNFYLTHKESLFNFSGLKISCNPEVEKCFWIKYLAQDKATPLGITTNPKMVSWNKNSGAAAISLAAHTGVKRIFLLGFDMKLSETNKQHWHSEYKNPQEPLNLRKLPFQRHLTGFPSIYKDAKNLNIQIYNVNSDSAITQFSCINLKEALEL